MKNIDFSYEEVKEKLLDFEKEALKNFQIKHNLNNTQ